LLLRRPRGATNP